ncbi:sensor histidine kinase [Geodermatophilus sp. SYSU D00691]
MAELAVIGGGLAQAVVTLALLARRPTHPVTLALAVSSTALVLGATPVADRYADALWVLGPPVLAVLLVVFPDGARGRGWRWVLRYQVAALAASVVLCLLWPVPDTSQPGRVVVSVLLVPFLPIAAAGVVSLVRLHRRSTGARRQRIGVVLGAGAVLIGLYLAALPLYLLLSERAPVVVDLLDMAFPIAFSLLPVAIGLSVLMEAAPARRRVADSLSLWVLTAAAALIAGATCAGAVALLSGTEVSPGPLAAAVLGAAGAAVLAVGLARRGAALVPTTDERAVAGLRDLAARLAGAPAPDEVPDRVAAAVGTALELRGTAVEARVGEGYERLATWRDPSGAATYRPLEHAGQVVGRLVLVPHTDGVPVDLSALDGLLPPVAAVVAAARLTAEVEHAHGRLLRIRDDERSRLRADMHDELSPSLSGLRLAITAARDRLAAGDPAAADGLLARVDEEAARAGSVVRAILEDLRPDDLVQQGLLAAVRQRASALSRPGSFEVEVDAPSALPVLSPEMELAVYRTVTEAVANAARHSGGERCSVRLAWVDDDLLLEVADDGAGLPAEPRAGVGLGSMSARARALGGDLELANGTSGGVRVRARFPVEAGR